MKITTSQGISKNDICQSFLLFLICILLLSVALSLSAALMLLMNTVTLVDEKESSSSAREACNYILCKAKGKIHLLFIENPAIFKAFSVFALTFDLRTHVYNFVLLSVARSSIQTRIGTIFFPVPCKTDDIEPWTLN